MNKLNRRTFLTMAGASSIAAGLAIPASGLANELAKGSDTLTFRAVGEVPSHPMPAFASYVVEGHVNLAARSGVVTKTLVAGGRANMSNVALPGLSRIIRITDVQKRAGTYQLRGIVDDRSLLQPGEASTFTLVINPSQQVAKTNAFGSDVLLTLER
jgi:hypothetical protein